MSRVESWSHREPHAAQSHSSEHIHAALCAIALLLFALLAGLAGLRISPAACVILAMALLFTDFAHR